VEKGERSASCYANKGECARFDTLFFTEGVASSLPLPPFTEGGTKVRGGKRGPFCKRGSDLFAFPVPSPLRGDEMQFLPLFFFLLLLLLPLSLLLPPLFFPPFCLCFPFCKRGSDCIMGVALPFGESFPRRGMRNKRKGGQDKGKGKKKKQKEPFFLLQPKVAIHLR
jgi:hypothetical protein